MGERCELSVMSIGEWQVLAHKNSVAKGWWQGVDVKDVNVVGMKLALVHSEISEGLEEVRVGELAVRYAGDGKPEGFGIEMADAVIRIMDLCAALGVDLAECIEIKHDYNLTRPHRHGGKLA